MRKSLWSVEPQLDKGFDQAVLNSLVWPTIRDLAAVFDSYNCREVERFGQSRAWPTQREGYRYVGYGPSKQVAVKALSRQQCPAECRPEDHQDWLYC